jgi:hypothetical protein
MLVCNQGLHTCIQMHEDVHVACMWMLREDVHVAWGCSRSVHVDADVGAHADVG